MRKAHSIALAVVVALVAAAPAQADQWWVPEATTGQVARQEQGRHSDPRLFGPAGSEPAGVSSTAGEAAAAADALEARSEALNQEYGLGTAGDAAAAAALEARSEALNQEYGLGTASTEQQIMRQERGRQSDRRLFGPSGPAPVLVASQPEGFDLGDAAVGGAVAFAFALLAAATFVFAGSRRQRTA